VTFLSFFFLVVCHHTASPPSTAGTHTGGVEQKKSPGKEGKKNPQAREKKTPGTGNPAEKILHEK